MINTLTLCKAATAAALFAVSTAVPAAAFATTLSKADYSAVKDRIGAEYKSDRDACTSYTANTKEVCLEQAKSKEKVASAALEYNYTGKPGDAQKLAVARADSAYATSKELCDDNGANSKDACINEAKAARAKALAAAKVGGKFGEAPKDAADGSRDADYKGATEKCDVLAGDAKSACLAGVKTRFNKN